MTAAALNLPIAAGGVVLEYTGNALHWGFARYMRAPLAHTAILAMLTLTSMAASNALYNQRQHHPSPLFAPFQQAREVEPVIPADRPERPAAAAEPVAALETTGSVSVAPVLSLGNAEVTEIQRKLHSMQIYDGAVDGLYGPRTARAIKAFEERLGMPPKGELSLALLDAVRGASVVAAPPRVEPLPTPDPLPQAIQPAAQVAPVVVAVAPVEPTGPAMVQSVAAAPAVTKPVTQLAAPAPLVTNVQPRSLVPQKPALTREIPKTPEQAMELVAKTTGEAIDTIVDGVQSVTMTTPGKKPAPQQALVETRVAPRIGVPLKVEEQPSTMSSADVAVLDTDAKPEDLAAFSVSDPATVAKVQRGLASLGFLQGAADGVAGEATATAIRRFEVWYNYQVTGQISPELLDLLVANGAVL